MARRRTLATAEHRVAAEGSNPLPLWLPRVQSAVRLPYGLSLLCIPSDAAVVHAAEDPRDPEADHPRVVPRCGLECIAGPDLDRHAISAEHDHATGDDVPDCADSWPASGRACTDQRQPGRIAHD